MAEERNTTGSALLDAIAHAEFESMRGTQHMNTNPVYREGRSERPPIEEIKIKVKTGFYSLQGAISTAVARAAVARLLGHLTEHEQGRPVTVRGLKERRGSAGGPTLLKPGQVIRKLEEERGRDLLVYAFADDPERLIRKRLGGSITHEHEAEIRAFNESLIETIGKASGEVSQEEALKHIRDGAIRGFNSLAVLESNPQFAELLRVIREGRAKARGA